MTPAALTPAARDATPRRKVAPKSVRAAPESIPATAARASAAARTGGATRTSSARSAGHRAPARAPARASAVPRRVSGPATGAPRSRRISAPVRGGAPTRPARRAGARPITLPQPAILVTRASAIVRALPDHRLLDRVVRGRSWIPILGLLLTGIVAMQVETLRLSASTGRSLERVTALQSRNEQLQASVAVLADDQRIERLAAGMNMVMPGPTQVRFLAPRGGSVTQALAAVRAPNATTFRAGLSSASIIAPTASAGAATTVPVTPAAPPVTPAVAPSSAAVAPTGSSAINTGVAGVSSSG